MRGWEGGRDNGHSRFDNQAYGVSTGACIPPETADCSSADGTSAHALRVRDALEVAPLKYEAGQEQHDSGVRYAIANGGQHIPGRNRNAVNRFSFDVE